MTPILEMENVTKRFGGLRAVKSVSLAMNEGEILFIIGPNGAGKTTVFNLISGFLHPNEGIIRFQGNRHFQNVAGPRRAPGHWTDIPDREAHSQLDRTGKRDAGRVHAYPQPRPCGAGGGKDSGLSPDVAPRANFWLKVCRWPHSSALKSPAHLATKPKLILLDEVVSGLTTSEALALAELVKRLPEWGVSVVGGVEHVMQVVMKIAHRVIVLDYGAKIAEGAPAQVVKLPEVIEAYLGPKYKELTQ